MKRSRGAIGSSVGLGRRSTGCSDGEQESNGTVFRLTPDHPITIVPLSREVVSLDALMYLHSGRRPASSNASFRQCGMQELVHQVISVDWRGILTNAPHPPVRAARAGRAHQVRGGPGASWSRLRRRLSPFCSKRARIKAVDGLRTEESLCPAGRAGRVRGDIGQCCFILAPGRFPLLH